MQRKPVPKDIKAYRRVNRKRGEKLYITRNGMEIVRQHPGLRPVLMELFEKVAKSGQLNLPWERGSIKVTGLSRDDMHKGSRNLAVAEINFGGEKLFCKVFTSPIEEKIMDAPQIKSSEFLQNFLREQNRDWNGIKIRTANYHFAFERGMTQLMATDFYDKDYVQGMQLGSKELRRCRIAIDALTDALREKGIETIDLREHNYFYNAEKNTILLFDFWIDGI